MEKRAESSRPPPRRWGDGPFRFGKEGRERRNGWRDWAQGWRLAEDDRRQRCAGLVGSRARMGEQFNGWLNTMPGTAGLCWAYCIRTASVRRRVDEQSGSAQVGAGNSAKAIRETEAFSVVRLRGEVSRRSGRFRWGSLYGKGGGVAEKRWGSRRKG